MNDISSRVVDYAVFEEESAAPYTKCADAVGEGEPERDENHPCSEIHAAEEGSSEQDERNSRENELKVHHRCLWEGLGQDGRWQIRLFQFEA